MVIDLTNTGQNHKLNLRCNGIILQQLDCFKYLGIVIDNQLKWERHITEVTKRIHFNNARLRMLRNILPRDVLIKLFKDTVQVRLHFTYKFQRYSSSQRGNTLRICTIISEIN